MFSLVLQSNGGNAREHMEDTLGWELFRDASLQKCAAVY